MLEFDDSGAQVGMSRRIIPEWEGVSVHGGSSSEGERTDRERHQAFQEAMREGWNLSGIAEARALRKAQCSTQEESLGCKETILTSSRTQWILSDLVEEMRGSRDDQR